MSGHDIDDDTVLLAQLRALPRERIPPAGSWERIAAGIACETPATGIVAPAPAPAPAPRHRARRRWWLAGSAAAAVVAAVIGVGRLAGPAPMATAPVLGGQAAVLDQDYQRAIAALPAPAAGGLSPALAELDRSADTIRAALRETPDAGFLLEQLQRTHALRLDLTRRAVFEAALHD